MDKQEFIKKWIPATSKRTTNNLQVEFDRDLNSLLSNERERSHIKEATQLTNFYWFLKKYKRLKHLPPMKESQKLINEFLKEPNQPDEQEQLMYEEGFADGKISESKNPELLKALNRLDPEKANIKAIKDHTKEVTKSKKSAIKFLTDGGYFDDLNEQTEKKEPKQPEEDINTTKGAEKYLKRHGIDIDSYVEKGLKKITRVLKSNPNTSEEVKNKVRQILKKEKEEQPEEKECPICKQEKVLINNLYCEECNEGISDSLGLRPPKQ